MISVMLAISHVVMLSRMAQSSFKTLHKIGLQWVAKANYKRYREILRNIAKNVVL